MSPSIDEADGVDLVGYHDLDGRPAFKLAIQRHGQRWYLYTGHLWDSGWTVVDVTDPARPETLRFVPGPEGMRTSQIQVANGIMVTGIEAQFGTGQSFDPDEPGFILWDVASDPSDPSILGHHSTGGGGTHRNFYDGGRYVYATLRSPPGFGGFILGIVDVGDPRNPVEVGRWCMPAQRLPEADGPVDELDFIRAHGPGLHGPAYVLGDRAYASWGHNGALILDLSDPVAPELISSVGLGALHGFVGCHSAVPYPDSRLLVINGEAVGEGHDAAPQYVAVVDVSDERNPRVLSTCPVPRPTQGLGYGSYYDKGGRFGPHNQHHHQGHPDHHRPTDAFPITFFNAGLRIFSIADPYMPEEVGHFVPGPPERRFGSRPASALVCHFEDVLVDARGNIFCSDDNQGLFILRSPRLV